MPPAGRDVALVVSTARVARASDIPDVPPLRIDFWQAPMALSEGAAPKAVAAAPMAADLVAKMRTDESASNAQLSGVARPAPLPPL